MERNERVSMASFHADKIDTVSILYHGLHRVKTGLGDKNAFVLTPSIDKGKVLKRADGLKFFIAQKERIPVMFEFDMRVGALRAVLKSYKIDGVEQIHD